MDPVSAKILQNMAHKKRIVVDENLSYQTTVSPYLGHTKNDNLSSTTLIKMIELDGQVLTLSK